MPKSYNLSAAEKELIKNWIDNGYLLNKKQSP